MDCKFVIKVALMSTCLWQGFCCNSYAGNQKRLQTPRHDNRNNSKNDKIDAREECVTQYCEEHCRSKERIFRHRKAWPDKCVRKAIDYCKKKSQTPGKKR